MVYKFVLSCFVVLLLFPHSLVVAQTCSALAGIWENELGSQLAIDSVGEDGSLYGEYRSSTGVDGKIFPLKGWVNNTDSQPVTMAFAVRWEGYGSITAWTGYCDTDAQGPHIRTMWHLVRPDTEFAWERIIANSSVFRVVSNMRE